MSQGQSLLQVRDLKKHFPARGGFFSRAVGVVKAVDGISFDLKEGETLGLVGESGSGKTTAAMAILRLIEPTSGSVVFEGRNLAALGSARLREARRRFQVIFQDPYGSLNPRSTVGKIIGEGLAVHRICRSRRERIERVREVMASVGLDPAAMDRYPHEFSGGQRQRIGIARALVLEPRLLVCDEPVSALDVSIQSQILNLLSDLKEKYGLTYLFISHDLSVVGHLSDRIAVMYLGRIVEIAPADELFSRPRHPYTRALLASVPGGDPRLREERKLLAGDPPSPLDPPPGCPFHPRCPRAMDICRREWPEELDLAGHKVWCHEVSRQSTVDSRQVPGERQE